MNRPRVAVYGGTFNPIHNGHLQLAQHILDNQIADEVLFVPTAFPAHKTNIASYKDRCEMVKLAIKDRPGMGISLIEGTLASPSYTIQTLDALSSRMLDKEFSWVIGADELNQLHTWDPDPIRLVRSYSFITYLRKGVAVDLAELNAHWPGWICKRLLDGVVFDADLVEISSSELREKLQTISITSIAGLNADVKEYISSHNLYGTHAGLPSRIGLVSYDVMKEALLVNKTHKYAYWNTNWQHDPSKEPVIIRAGLTKSGNLTFWFFAHSRVTRNRYMPWAWKDLPKWEIPLSEWSFTMPDCQPWTQHAWLYEEGRKRAYY